MAKEILRIVPNEDITSDHDIIEKYSLEELLHLRLKIFFHELEKNGIEEEHNLYEKILKIVDKSLIKLTLKKTSNNRSKCAKILGLNRNTLNKKIKQLKITVVKE